MSAALEARVAQLEAAIVGLSGRLGRVEASPSPALSLDAFAGLSSWTVETVHAAIDIAARAFRVPLADITAIGRDGRIIKARFTSMWLVRQATPLSSLRIAACFGGRDHSTVLHALRRAEEWRMRDDEYRDLTDRLLDQLHALRVEWAARPGAIPAPAGGVQ